MDASEKKRYLVQHITKESVLKNRTTIIIGEAVKIFKAIFTGNIISITTAEEIRGFLDTYSKPSEDILVFEDISLMSNQIQTYLLKYLESDYRPLVVLASIDNVSPIILSRFVNVVKLPEEIKLDFTTLDAFLEEHAMDLKSNYILPELKEDSVKYCPEYFYNYKKMALAKHENKNRNQIIRYL